ncbi:MAG TPA: DUF2961 domain-containing protein [Sandaracinaceae bacterium LLY-WYZ-13_1]|nr:DUF2961 domain-containing protein [Sandaracinaceae bacterium LLY-WYZ-13_1]
MRHLAWIVALASCAGCDGTTPELDDGDCATPAAPDGGTGRADGGGPPPPTFDAFAQLADPYLPARRLPGEVHLASSRAPEPADGFDNHDWSHFVRVEDGEAVLLEEAGPGVVTRIWFTFRHGAMGMEVGDRQRLHLTVDGEEIVFVEGERGVTLGELTSGTLPGFPRPWVAGRDLSSDAQQLFVPIHFDRSIRIAIDEVPDEEWIAYYQIDWRALPDDLCVRSFDGSLTAAEEAALADATAIWVDGTDGPAESLVEELVLAPGDAEVLDLAEPAVLRAVAFEVLEGALDGLEASLVVDGETVADGAARRWMHAEPFVEGFTSAMASGAPRGGRMAYPTPVRDRAAYTLRNGGGAPLTVRARLGFDPGIPPDDLGALRARCGAPTIEETGGNAALLEVDGQRGHYAGQWLVLRGQRWGWTMLEGDHEVFVDGEPRLLGTGTEDYFGGAFYYLRGPFALPLAGAPGYDLMGRGHLEANPVHAAQYRHHLLDAVAFDEAFSFQVEVTAPGTRYEHCSFYYVDP